MAKERRVHLGQGPTNAGPQRSGHPNGRKNLLARRARRDVRLSYRPFLQENERAQAAAGSAYGALPGELKDIGQGYTAASDQIAGNLTDQLAALQGALPTYDTAPGDELGAFFGAYGTAGEAGLGMLGSQAQRGATNLASNLSEAGYAQRSALDNLLQQRQQITQNMPQDILKRIDELREQRLTQQLARSQMESDEATSKYLMDLIGGQLAESPSHPRPGQHYNPRPGNSNNGNNNNQGTSNYVPPSSPPQTTPGVTPPTSSNPPPGTSLSPMAKQIRRRVRDIEDTLNFSELPTWLKDLYQNYPEGSRWSALELYNAPARRRQVFRRTKDYVQPLYEASQY